MKFAVQDLKLLNKMVLCTNTDEEILLSDSLKQRQPGFYEEVEDVGIDMACLVAQRDDRLGKREQTYPDRIQRHVLIRNDFDDEDFVDNNISLFGDT
jgi:hypothetical protein